MLSGEGLSGPCRHVQWRGCKTNHDKQARLQHVSSFPEPLFQQQLGGGWTRAKEQQGQNGLCVELYKES